MANKPVAGSWGRIRVVKVAPDLTTPTLSWTGTTAALFGATSWKAQDSRSGGTPSILHFECPADTEGVLSPTLIRGGTAEITKVNLEGFQDIDATNGTQILIPQNAAVVLDLLFFKTGNKGYVGVDAVVESFSPGGKVDDKAFAWSMTVAVQGPFSSYLSL